MCARNSRLFGTDAAIFKNTKIDKLEQNKVLQNKSRKYFIIKEHRCYNVFLLVCYLKHFLIVFFVLFGQIPWPIKLNSQCFKHILFRFLIRRYFKDHFAFTCAANMCTIFETPFVRTIFGIWVVYFTSFIYCNRLRKYW